MAFDLGGADLDLAIANAGRCRCHPTSPTNAPRTNGTGPITRRCCPRRRIGSRADRGPALHPGADRGPVCARSASHFVTLHVGAGTFLPVKAERVADHRMHAEFGEVSPAVAAALNAARAAGGRVICVGTTSLRLLESAVDSKGCLHPFSGETAIFITPGRPILAAEGLITNFHLPRSTLFMLTAAFSGLETMRRAYRHAIHSGYRFYSYGDASLLWRAD